MGVIRGMQQVEKTQTQASACENPTAPDRHTAALGLFCVLKPKPEANMEDHSDSKAFYTERFNIRARPDEAQLIARAAAAEFTHLSSFFRRAAVKEAKRILRRAELAG